VEPADEDDDDDDDALNADAAVIGIESPEFRAWLAAPEEVTGGEDEGDADPADDDEDAELFEVWPENWPAVQLFVRCATQWMWTMSARTGLNYPGVQVIMTARARRRDHAALWDDLFVMEKTALVLLNRKRTAT
jgi:hypothetical protein